MKTPTLQQLHRIMESDPREWDAEMFAWAIDVLEHRLTLIPAGTPAHEPYAFRLAFIRRMQS